MTISDAGFRFLSWIWPRRAQRGAEQDIPGDSKRGWQTYPGDLDIDIRYRLLARLHALMPALMCRPRKRGQTRAVNLFSHGGKAVTPLDDRDIPLVTQVRNARRYLPSFLAHYRKLGVTRFIFVDDGSDDGGADYLAAMADVDLYQSDISYMDSNRGILFKEEITRRYGVNRWWLFIDVDEYLFYEAAEERSLRDLIEALEKRKIRRLLAPLLDMYPLGDVDQAEFDGSDSTMPWEVAAAFDGAGYFTRFRGKDWEIRGGVRRRVFGNLVELAKYPLMYVSEETYFRSIHYPRPAHDNCVPILGCLLHFKIFSDYETALEKAAAEGRYFGNSKHYRIALETIARDRPTFHVPGVSQTFVNSAQLLEMLFFKSSR